MCGIIGFINCRISQKALIESLKKIKNRGRDAIGLFYNDSIKIYNKIPEKLESNFRENNEKIILSHLLHSIEGFTPQPIKEKGILSFNGEIYNYLDLNKRFNFRTENDSETLLKLLDFYLSNKNKTKIFDLLDEIDGDYAFSYVHGDKLFLVRDRIGIKPLWYHIDKDNSISFASEKKAISINAKELPPNKILIYDINSREVEFLEKKELILPNENNEDYKSLKIKLRDLLIKSVKKRIPTKNKKIGLLFSGGIDSSAIALILKEINVDFICFTAQLEDENLELASDVKYSKEIAKKYGLKLEISKIRINELEKILIEVMRLIEDRDYIKVSVAVPFFLACKKAKEFDIEIMFSGLGSEEIFAGYRRHRQSENPNMECLEGLKIMHKRDLYRDDVITMNFNQELRVPFLDNDLINYSLSIPEKYKLDLNKLKEIKKLLYKNPHLSSEIRSKIILRDVINEFFNLDKEYSERIKKAAQYGSKFDKGILRLAKNNNKTKQEYLDFLWKKYVEN